MSDATGVEVVVVDDDPELCETVSSLLSECGYTVRTFPNAERLLAEPKAAGVDLVIADVQLPGQSGVDLIETLHRRDPDLALLVITGYPSARTARQAFRGGVIDYLPKPFEPEQLLAAVREALDARSARRHQRWQLAQLRALVGELAPAVEGPSGATPSPPAAAGPAAAGLQVDLEQGRVFRGGTEIALTRTEYVLLSYLFRHRPRVVDPRELAEAARGERLSLWEARELCKPHIRNLRRKLGAEPGGGASIVNIHGRGYRLD